MLERRVLSGGMLCSLPEENPLDAHNPCDSPDDMRWGHTHTYAHACMHTHAHTRMHALILHAHTCMHAHTYTCFVRLSVCLCHSEPVNEVCVLNL